MADWSEIDNRLLDPNWYTTGEYHEVFKRLRDEDPVHWAEDASYGKNYWVITRHEDVRECLNNPQRFSSRWDTRVPRSPKRRTPEERHAQGWDVNISTNDNPIHDLYRRPINKHFSVPAIGRLANDVHAIVDEIIADVAGKGECDLVEDMAEILPMKVILRMLGVPLEDWEEVRIATWQWFMAADPRWIINGDEVATSLYGHKKLIDYCTDLAIKRRKEPRDDFATVIGNLEIDGDKLSVHEMQQWFVTLIGGGLETTRNALSVGSWLFLANPGQRQRLLEDPSLTKSAIEEVLRWVTPAKSKLRVATEDFDYQGRRVRTGDWVIAFLASADKDERVFPDPHRFDIARTPNDHLAFGSGIHLCIARALARLELAAFFPKILAAFPDLATAPDWQPAWIADRTVTGFTSMPVTYSPVEPARSQLAGAGH